MSKKSFLIILVLSLVVWFLSVVLQGLLGTLFSFNPLSGGCHVTGYPLAVCDNSYEELPFGYYILNIGFWFLVIWLTWKGIQKVLKR